MRKISLYIFTTLILIWWFFPYLKSGFQTLNRLISNRTLVENYISSLCFQPVKDNWLTVSIPDTTIYRISCTPVSNDDPNNLGNNLFEFSIQYRLLNQDGNVILEKPYYFTTKYTKSIDMNTQKNIQGAYIDESPESTILDTKFCLINCLQQKEKPAILQIRLHSKDKAIQSVFFRLYAYTVTEKDRNPDSWRRLSSEKKDRLAEKMALPKDFLSVSELSNMAAQLWTTSAPDGIPDIDYISRRIFFYKEVLKERDSEFLNHEGLLISPEFNGIVPLPPSGGSFQFRFEPVNQYSEKLKQPSRLIRLDWAGRKDNTQSETVIWNSQVIEKMFSFPGGEITVIPPEPMILRVFKVDIKPIIDITPEPITIKSILLSPENHIEYKLFPYKNTSTPVKLSIRTLLNNNLENPAIICHVYDKTGALIVTKVLISGSNRTFLEQYVEETTLIPSAESIDHFLFLPSAAERLVLKTDNGMYLINCYNRTTDMKRKSDIPQSHYLFHRNQTISKNWFSKDPENHIQLLKRNYEKKITVQNQTEQPENILNDNESFLFETLVPTSEIPARICFVERESGNQPSHTIFSPVPANIHTKINFYNPTTQYPEPECLILGNNGGNLSVFVDNISIPLSRNKAWQLLSLGRMENGTHSIKIQSECDVSAYLNFLSNPEGRCLIKKTVFPMKTPSLIFKGEKTNTEEQLFIRVYSHDGFKSPLKLNVTLSGEPFSKKDIVNTKWTYPLQSFLFSDLYESRAFMLETNQTLFESDVAIISLNNDTRQGQYIIQCDVDGNIPCFISIVRSILGPTDEFNMYYEGKEEYDNVLD